MRFWLIEIFVTKQKLHVSPQRQTERSDLGSAWRSLQILQQEPTGQTGESPAEYNGASVRTFSGTTGLLKFLLLFLTM